MDLHAETLLHLHADEVFSRARDELHDFASHMPDLHGFELVRAVPRGPSVERVDRVSARVAPVVLAGRGFSEAHWLLHSSWHAPSRSARWRIDVERPAGALHAEGAVEVLAEPAGRARIQIRGHVQLRPEALGLGAVGRMLSRSIEKMLATRIETNLHRLFAAIHEARSAA
jgi:hypothetical protein